MHVVPPVVSVEHGVWAGGALSGDMFRRRPSTKSTTLQDSKSCLQTEKPTCPWGWASFASLRPCARRPLGQDSLCSCWRCPVFHHHSQQTGADGFPRQMETMHAWMARSPLFGMTHTLLVRPYPLASAMSMPPSSRCNSSTTL